MWLGYGPRGRCTLSWRKSSPLVPEIPLLSWEGGGSEQKLKKNDIALRAKLSPVPCGEHKSVSAVRDRAWEASCCAALT